MPPALHRHPDIDRYELATILAALRLLQEAPALPEAIQEIATEVGDFERLDGDRIDAVSEYPWRDVTEDAALEEHVAARF